MFLAVIILVYPTLSILRLDMEGRQAYLRLTDYVSGSDLCELSADALQTLVCGPDGLQLERIRQRADASIVRFVSAPFPGFHVSCRSATHLQLAIVELEAVMNLIKRTARANQRSVAVPVARNERFYHPLYSRNQHHLIMPSGGLLPLPEPRLSDTEYKQLVTSPYLTAFRKTQQRSLEPDTSTESSDRPEPAAAPDDVAPFDKELEGCLPGVPGVRQSKDYKRIRRKITEIDALSKTRAELDKAQLAKISKRPEYVAQLRRWLLTGIAVPSCESPLVPVTPQTDTSVAEAAEPVVERVTSCVSLPVPSAPARRKKKPAPVAPAPVTCCTPTSRAATRKQPKERLGIAELLRAPLAALTRRARQYLRWLSEAWAEFFIGSENPYCRLSVLSR